MTIEDLHSENLVLFECISGSKAFGLDTPESDTDIKGVFYLPKQRFYGLDYIPQINNASNDIMFYEIGRYIELLLKNNPNMLEMLASPEDCILFQHPLMKKLSVEQFLSKRCRDSFSSYAIAQVRKARAAKRAQTDVNQQSPETFQQYDGKNMMHTIRLLQVAEEIGRTGKINVRRSNREELLNIKSGTPDFESLLQQAEDLYLQIDLAFSTSSLPDTPDKAAIIKILVALREELYRN